MAKMFTAMVLLEALIAVLGVRFKATGYRI
jgi:hypothetical protein